MQAIHIPNEIHDIAIANRCKNRYFNIYTCRFFRTQYNSILLFIAFIIVVSMTLILYTHIVLYTLMQLTTLELSCQYQTKGEVTISMHPTSM